MARPIKQGLDYFPLDVHLDNKFKFIEVKHGLEGFAIVVKIMQGIYSDGYWMEFTEDDILLFAAEHRIDTEKVEAVLAECLKRGIFDPKIYEQHKVLTSSGIQKRYKLATSRRTSVTVIPEYTLIDDLKEVNADKNPAKKDKPQQEPPEAPFPDANEPFIMDDEDGPKLSAEDIAYRDVANFYNQNMGVLNAYMKEEFEAFLEDFNFQSDIVIAAMKVSLDIQAGWAHTKSVLTDWRKNKVKTLDDARARQLSRKKTSGRPAAATASDYENA